MKFIFAKARGSHDFREALFSFTGTDPGAHGVCADVAD
jgi:hypothetical protein